MNWFLKLTCFFALCISQNDLFAQLSSASMYAVEDSYTTTALPNNNFGNNITMKSGTEYVAGAKGTYFQYHQRAFVKFDLSSIPTNAIIYSAELRLVLSGNSTGTFDWNTKLIKSSWGEGSITANNQPTISSLSGDYVITSPVTSGTQSINVKGMVQRMVYGAANNYGWCIQVNNEAATTNSGAWFHTSEASNQFVRPLLFVQYYLPLTLSNVSISHESGVGASDGSINYDHTSLGSTTHTYQWYNGAGQLMLGEVNKQITNIPYGWYGVEITGVSTGEKAYYGFLVGTECEEVTISYRTSPNYTFNSYTYDRVIAGGIDYRDQNYGNTTYFRSDNWNNSPWTDIKSYIDFNTWMDDAFTVNQADLALTGWSHWNSGTTNEAQFNLVNDSWNENVMTWNASPSVAASPIATIPNTTSSNQNSTIDMVDAWNTWKTNNLTNYGVEFRLQYFDDNYNTRHMYYSPNEATASRRPFWTFKLSLIDNFSFSYCHPDWPPHSELQRQLSGAVAMTSAGVLRFQFDEEYKVDAGSFVEFELYDESRTVLASCNSQGTTTGNVAALTYSFDDNRYDLDLSNVPGISNGSYYILEVKTAKGQKRYLKVLYQA